MYIHNYPAVANKINLFNYSNEATVYPNWVPGNISGLNPEVFTNNDTVTIEGETITVSIDFSGINVSPRLLGDAGGIYGGAGRCNINDPIEGCCEFGDGYDNRTNSEHCRDYGWPFCNAYWGYALPSTQGGQGGDVGCQERTLSSPIFRAPDGRLKFPYRTISGISQEDGAYWNNPTLWNNGFANTTAFLAEHDGAKHGESGGYEYLLSLGHPITTQPCRDEPYTFSFWDPQQNTFISRKFRCPCVAWGTSTPCSSCGVENSQNAWIGKYCTGDDAVLTNDAYRLWIMDSNEPPIPNYIKRYKLLKGELPVGLPSYVLRRSNLISKEIVEFSEEFNEKILVPDLNIPGSYGFKNLNNQLVNYIAYSGEGDDGQIVLTVTKDGETIVHRKDGVNVGTITIQGQLTAPITGENRCNDIYNDLFIKNGNFLDINSWCVPDIYHRDEVQNPKKLLTNTLNALPEATSANDSRNRLNVRLEQLGKPKLVFYSYGSSINEGDSINLPEINQNNVENLPLKTSPYLSRESLNNIFRNTNVVAFRQQKMLQASELNEIQEKFYRKQKLLVEHTRNWLTRENLIQNPNDLFCTSDKNVIFENYRLNKCLPIEQNKITIDSTADQFSLNIDPTYLLLKSNFKQGILNEVFRFTLLQSNPHKSLNFYKLQNRLTIGFTIDNLTETNVKIFTIGVDYGNLISCNEYPELRDNSGGSVQTAPCGADRNVLIDKFTNTIIANIETSQGARFDAFPAEISNFESQSPLNNYSTRETNVPFMVAYMIKQNNNVNIYYPNGLLITSIPTL
jgi:hypothetical protein